LLIDDVISAGTATKESIELLKKYNSKIDTMAIALDRQMILDTNSNSTASQNIVNNYNINIFNIINLQDLIDYTKNNSEYDKISKLLENNN